MSESDRPVLHVVPVRLRWVAAVSAVVLVALFAVLAVLLPSSENAGIGTRTSFFGTGDRVALVLLGVLLAAGVLLLARPRLDADERVLRVRNILGTREVPWDLVVAVRFDEGSPWVSLELPDDELIPVMAVQAADGDRAFDAVEALRRLHLLSRRRARGDSSS